MTKINVNNESFQKYLQKYKIRFCKNCEKFKPDRSHHCRQCSRCVLKMDHHCNWILSCVGFRNYRYFLQFIFYSELLLIYYSSFFTESVLWNDLLEVPSTGIEFYFKSLNWIFSLSFSFLLGLLNVFHLAVLLGKNLSTIEFCENKNDKGKYS